MATILDLVAAGRLIKLDPGLSWREQEERRIFLFSKVVTWIDGVLPYEMPIPPNELIPIEQLDQLTYDFCVGHEFIFDRQIHPLKHISSGIWELKAPDIRLFGWFPMRDTFICTAGDTMERVKTHRLYNGYRDEAVSLRNALPLDEPKFVPGDNPDDVISACYYPSP